MVNLGDKIILHGEVKSISEEKVGGEVVRSIIIVVPSADTWSNTVTLKEKNLYKED